MECGNVDKAPKESQDINIDIDMNEGSVPVATTQLLVHLPDGLLRRFKRHVSVRQRSRFIQRLLEDALPPEDRDDDPLSKRHWPSRKTRHWRLKWPSGKLPLSLMGWGPANP